jgi:hypothetical protein
MLIKQGTPTNSAKNLAPFRGFLISAIPSGGSQKALTPGYFQIAAPRLILPSVADRFVFENLLKESISKLCPLLRARVTEQVWFVRALVFGLNGGNAITKS